MARIARVYSRRVRSSAIRKTFATAFSATFSSLFRRVGRSESTQRALLSPLGARPDRWRWAGSTSGSYRGGFGRSNALSCVRLGSGILAVGHQWKLLHRASRLLDRRACACGELVGLDRQLLGKRSIPQNLDSAPASLHHTALPQERFVHHRIGRQMVERTDVDDLVRNPVW